MEWFVTVSHRCLTNRNLRHHMRRNNEPSNSLYNIWWAVGMRGLYTQLPGCTTRLVELVHGQTAAVVPCSGSRQKKAILPGTGGNFSGQAVYVGFETCCHALSSAVPNVGSPRLAGDLTGWKIPRPMPVPWYENSTFGLYSGH